MIWACLGGTLLLAALLASTGVLPVPMGLRHLVNLARRPADLYEPIVHERFPFAVLGATASYPLVARHLDYHELRIVAPPGTIPASYRFGGRLEATFLHSGRVLRTERIERSIAARYAPGDMGHLVAVTLLRFPIPMNGLRKELELKLEVLAPDPALAALGDQVELQIAVSSTP